MALTDILFSKTSAVAARGDVGSLVDILMRRGFSGFASPTFYGGYWTVSETFKNSASVDVADGTAVWAYHSTTGLLVGQGVVAGGGGVAAFQVTTGDNVYLVVDPSAMGGETLCTTLVALT